MKYLDKKPFSVSMYTPKVPGPWTPAMYRAAIEMVKECRYDEVREMLAKHAPPKRSPHWRDPFVADS